MYFCQSVTEASVQAAFDTRGLPVTCWLVDGRPSPRIRPGLPVAVGSVAAIGLDMDETEEFFQ
eukprot:9034795-Lingulodinium_polyedra.AAC.1